MAEPLWLWGLGIGVLGGILTGVPVMLVIAGVPLLAAFAGIWAGVFPAALIGAYPARVFGIMGNTLLLAVPLFVLMGVLLERARLAERMLAEAAAALGGSRRALALSVLGVSALIAAATGIIGATIVMLTLISLPALRRAGIGDGTASGLVCAAGTLGQIVPPSIVLVLLGDQIANAYLDAQQRAGNFAPDPVTVADLFAGALVPGLCLVGLYGLYLAILLRPRGLGAAASGGDEGAMAAEGGGGAASLAAGLAPPLVLIVAVLGSILAGIATPTEAAAIGVAGTLLIAQSGDPGRPWRLLAAAGGAAALALAVLRGLGAFVPGAAGIPALALTALLAVALAGAGWRLWRRGVLAPALADTARVSGIIFGIILAASMLSLVFRGFGGDQAVEQALGALPGGAPAMLLTSLALIFLLGFILDFVEIVFIVVPIVGPVLLTEIDPVWFAVLVALNLQTSFLTPPFGFALFYFRAAAPAEIATATIYRAVIPFVAIQLATLALVYWIPSLATWLPGMLFDN